MSPHVRAFVVWGPRVFGLAVAGFVALFALDAFDGRPIVQALPDFAKHLVPAAVVGAVVAVGWRFPWAGALGFACLAAGYATMVPNRPDWILVISGPLVVVAILFALAGLVGGRRDSGRPRLV